MWCFIRLAWNCDVLLVFNRFYSSSGLVGEHVTISRIYGGVLIMFGCDMPSRNCVEHILVIKSFAGVTSLQFYEVIVPQFYEVIVPHDGQMSPPLVWLDFLKA